VSTPRPPSVFVDPGPYRAAIVFWRGIALVYLGAPPPQRKAAGDDDDDDIIVVQPPKPPIAMKLAANLGFALQRDVDELKRTGEEITLAEDPFRKSFLWHTDDLVGGEPTQTVLFLVEGGNVIDLNEYTSLVEDAAGSDRSLVIRFTRDG
jgi:hypothetical protein